MRKYNQEILRSNVRKGRILKYLLREGKSLFTPRPKNKKWIFVLGCYNSGTTLLHKLLATSEEIASLPGEGQFLTNQFLVPSHIGLSRMWIKEIDKFYLDGDHNGPHEGKLKKQWTSYMNHPEREYYMEKSPTDIARIKWLEENFDHPLFVAIVRNGYAVAEGIRRKAGYPIDDAIAQWKISNDIMLRDLEGCENKLVISYEELTADPNQTLDKVFNFLGISKVSYNASSVLNIHGVKSSIENKNHLSFENLTESDLTTIERTAGDTLEKLNYHRQKS